MVCQLEGMKMPRLADTFLGGSEYLLSREDNNSVLYRSEGFLKMLVC